MSDQSASALGKRQTRSDDNEGAVDFDDTNIDMQDIYKLISVLLTDNFGNRPIKRKTITEIVRTKQAKAVIEKVNAILEQNCGLNLVKIPEKENANARNEYVLVSVLPQEMRECVAKYSFRQNVVSNNISRIIVLLIIANNGQILEARLINLILDIGLISADSEAQARATCLDHLNKMVSVRLLEITRGANSTTDQNTRAYLVGPLSQKLYPAESIKAQLSDIMGYTNSNMTEDIEKQNAGVMDDLISRAFSQVSR